MGEQTSADRDVASACTPACSASTDLQRALAELERGRARYRALIQASAAVVWRASPDGTVVQVCHWTRYPGIEEAAAGDRWLDLLHPDDRDRVREHWARTVAARTGDKIEYRVDVPGLGYRWVLSRAVPLLAVDGSVEEWVGTLTDIHAAKTAHEEVRWREERLHLALHAGRMFAWERDLATGFITRSDHAKQLIGLESGPASEFLSRVHPDDRDKAPDIIARVWGADAGHNELRYVRPGGEILWLSARSVVIEEPGKPKRLVGVTFDITDRKRAEAEAWRLANQDALTRLPNRMHFQAQFERALADAKQNGTAVSLLLMDLDNFNDVNDTLGHEVGDALLCEIARRLAAIARDCDTVARVAGDEFAMVLVAPLTLDHAVRFADHLIDSIRQPFAHDGRLLEVKASVGVAAFPDHDAAVRDLMKDADIALHRAKAQGRNRVVAYTPDMRAAMEKRVRISAEVCAALAANQIVPFYQPKVCFSSGRLVGFEALARWQHPERGVLTPGYFGDAFTDPDIAEMIGEVMVGQVAADLRKWLSAGLDCGRVAVNLSSAEFRHRGLADSIVDVLAASGVPTSSFEVEVTETVLLGVHADLVAAALHRFREAGVTIALDDFGTGYASLTHLKQFPVDHIKIDQSFVRGLGGGGHDEAIVTAVIGLGKSLGINVTGEGVETEAQASRLRELGCTFGQGYLFGKPIAASRVPRWLEMHGTRAGKPILRLVRG